MSSPSPSDAPQCPVDESTRAAWLAQHRPSPSSSSPQPQQPPPPESASRLPTARETSSIPRAGASSSSSEHWVYPSQSQFYAAMARKHSAGSGSPAPNPLDMPVVVPIHNAVNERAWEEVRGWERGRGGERCGGVRLVSFRGRPGERTWRAWVNTLLGYQPPFDRHDWIIDRCGHQLRYIIDFYTGRAPSADSITPAAHPMAGPAPSALSFYLDVRPAPDSWEGVSMRVRRAWEDLVGRKK